MHTTKELDRTSFEYRIDGSTVSQEEAMPNLTSDDRVGIVMRTGPEGIGAGNFILSCVTTFYDYLRETRDGQFFEYPDYYTFQTTSDPADYRMLDIYPNHKNVTVEPDAERVLQAINDRAITTLLVPDVPPASLGFDDITLQSAHRRIDHCYVYHPEGRTSKAEFSIRLPSQTVNGWYETTIESIDSASEPSIPSFGSDDDWIVQQFRRVSVDQGLARLPVS